MLVRPKRPRDPMALAKRIGDIATRQVEDQSDPPPPSPAAELGSKGGKARASRLTPKQRAEAAKKAVNARWAKTRQQASTEAVAEQQTPKRRKAIRPPPD